MDAESVSTQTQRFTAGTIVWGAGIRASNAAQWLGVHADRAGRIEVAPDLSIPGWPEIFVIGDTGRINGLDGQVLPALAQVATQQGRYVGRSLANNRPGATIRPFKFQNRGNTAIIGRHAAVFDFGWLTLKGRLAWLLWAIVHIFLLIGFQNRVMVSIQWLWRYLSYERGARLILNDQAMSDEHPTTF
jgi:NADH dehydrogenase